MEKEKIAIIGATDKPDPLAALLLDIVKELDAPFGFERSFKVTQGKILDGRFLLSLHKNALGADPVARLTNIAAQLNMPTRHRDRAAATIADADILHLGFEPGETVTCKLYLEFASRFQNTISGGNESRKDDEPTLVHLAFKWDPAGEGPGTVARYLCQPGLTTERMTARLSAICGQREDRALFRMASGFLNMATTRMPGEDIFFMEVTEENNPRQSFDINVYDADMTLDAISPFLADTWNHFGVPVDRAHTLTLPYKHLHLGHISGGTGRDDKDFLTIYFGVEPH
jgi:tryptophan 7-halogenase